MAIPEKITNYLLTNDVSYRHKIHSVAYTSLETAAVEHVPGRELAKTVVLKSDRGLILAVLPSSCVINLEALKKRIAAKSLELAPENEFVRRFPSCQPGAMPPFGRLFSLALYCDRALAGQREIEFNAGTHKDTIRMEFSEFERLEAPVILEFADRFTGEPMARTA